MKRAQVEGSVGVAPRCCKSQESHAPPDILCNAFSAKVHFRQIGCRRGAFRLEQLIKSCFSIAKAARAVCTSGIVVLFAMSVVPWVQAFSSSAETLRPESRAAHTLNDLP
jgi:hypothetical protein